MARTVEAEYEKLFSDIRVSTAGGPRAVIQRLRELAGQSGIDVERLRKRLNAQLVEAAKKTIEDLLAKGDRRTAAGLESLSLDAQRVFAQKMRYLRELYLDDAEERIKGEQDDLKRTFLERLTDWAETGGELDVSDVVDKMQETAVNRARFFARDQFAKFNRAVMLAGYEQAGATYVEWLTSNDARVRPTHRERNHLIYTWDELLADPEYGSYNCRCGFAPVWELTAEQKRRRAA